MLVFACVRLRACICGVHMFVSLCWCLCACGQCSYMCESVLVCVFIRVSLYVLCSVSHIFRIIIEVYEKYTCNLLFLVQVL